MTKEAYIKQMRVLGWTDDYINKQLQIYEEAKKDGIDMPLELDLIERPID